MQHHIDAIDGTTSSLSSFSTFIFSTLRHYRAAADRAGAGRGPCRPVLGGVGLAAAHHAVEGHEEAVLRGEWRRSGVNSTPSPRRMPKNTKDAGRGPRGGGPRGGGPRGGPPMVFLYSYRAVVPVQGLPSG